ncbi:MAG: ATP-binding cassette domain-containing protein [Bacteroidales bacterium]|nr:ATP-binding cassette domain-containing protein [Bacteroidales bacterium]
MAPLITLRSAVVSNPFRRLAAPVDFELEEGEHIALVGDNGSGKSTLISMLSGGFYLREGTLRHNLGGETYRTMKTVRFNGAYGTTEFPYYYQQRWHAQERENGISVRDLLAQEPALDGRWRQELYDLLGMGPLLDRTIMVLSSGELRRYHLTRALLSAPKVLVLESPFIGLDPETRELLCGLMELVSARLGVSFIMSLTDVEMIPPLVTHVYFLKEGVCSAKMSRDEALRASSGRPESRLPLPDFPFALSRDAGYENAVCMRNVSISYGERTIFSGLDWTVRRGEAWNVTGPNGSGKSTLLSLVCADNPKAYSLDMDLFDVRRGTGESIWDIKKHIGYLSSEMHSGFNDNLLAVEVVAGGMADGYAGTGRNRAEDLAVSGSLLDVFGAGKLAQRLFPTLSSGEQRLVLLVRAFVRNPDLLILDEPFQGLDRRFRSIAKAAIERFCSDDGKTLLFVTHFPEELPAVIDNTLELHKN